MLNVAASMPNASRGQDDARDEYGASKPPARIKDQERKATKKQLSSNNDDITIEQRRHNQHHSCPP
jgi:hypothetical protein